MKWEQVRKQYPEQWVLVEATSAHSENGIRYMNRLTVMAGFQEPADAWRCYKKIHAENLYREYYIFHTNHPSVEVEEQRLRFARGQIL